MKKKGNIAVFISGRGSNFESIYEDSTKNDSNYKIVAVITDNPEAKGLLIAKKFNLNTFVFVRKNFKSKKEYEAHIIEVLNSYEVELICLAGYMRIVGKTLLNKYKNKIINIHPSLLPSFPGLDAQKQAFDYGVKISGCTVHFVDSGVDTGKIILQSSVDVTKFDTIESLSNKILKEEHIIYPRAIRLFFMSEII